MKTVKPFALLFCNPVLVLIFAATFIGCDEEDDNVDTIYIDDPSLEDVYYHQVSYDRPTILIFRNLTEATNSVYFHQCVNIREVHFPKLLSIGDVNSINPYLYFHQNEGLEKVDAPKLRVVYGYVYAMNNSLLDFSKGVCAIEDMYPRGEPDAVDCYDPSVNIAGNANNEMCFSAIMHSCN